MHELWVVQNFLIEILGKVAHYVFDDVFGCSDTILILFRDIDVTQSRLRSLFVFRVIHGNPVLNPYKRRLLAGHKGVGEHTIGSNASVDSKTSARAAKALANALDYLEKVDGELAECGDWTPGLRDRERVERSKKGRRRRNSRRSLLSGSLHVQFSIAVLYVEEVQNIEDTIIQSESSAVVQVFQANGLLEVSSVVPPTSVTKYYPPPRVNNRSG